MHKGAFSLHRASGPPQTGRSLRLIRRLTLDPRSLFTPNWSAGRAIPDYFGANQWCRTSVSRNDNHSLLITWKESQLAIQFFHYRLPLSSVQLCAVNRVNIVPKSNKCPFPMILVWDRKWVNVARYSVKDHLIGWWAGCRKLFISERQMVRCPRERPRSIRQGLFTPFLEGRTSVSSVRSEADRTSDGIKKRHKASACPVNRITGKLLGVSWECCPEAPPKTASDPWFSAGGQRIEQWMATTVCTVLHYEA